MDTALPADIRLLCLDVDGVLTDGSIWLDSRGDELKRFHVRDGLGIKAWQTQGNQIAVVTGRGGPAMQARMAEHSPQGLHILLEGA